METTTPFGIATRQISTLINSGYDDLTLQALEQLAELTVGMGDVNRRAQEVLTRFRKMHEGMDTREKDLGKIREIARKIISVSIPRYTGMQRIVGDLGKDIHVSPLIEEQLIHGKARSWEWLQKAFEKSRAICRVCVNGKPKGSGFLDKDGYLYTCNHVLSTAEQVKSSWAEFNFNHEGSSPVQYHLDDSNFITDPGLDYTRVKIIDQHEHPLSIWGFIEIMPTQKPGDKHLNIIHHPGGRYKHFSLLGAKIIIENQRIKYDCDTEGGSSGSPVFNDEWKAVAIHNGFDNKESNKGTLLYYIMENVRAGKKN